MRSVIAHLRLPLTLALSPQAGRGNRSVMLRAAQSRFELRTSRTQPISKSVEKRISLISSFRRKPEPSFSSCFLKRVPGFRRDDG